jgi:hypothetical protein
MRQRPDSHETREVHEDWATNIEEEIQHMLWNTLEMGSLFGDYEGLERAMKLSREVTRSILPHFGIDIWSRESV